MGGLTAALAIGGCGGTGTAPLASTESPTPAPDIEATVVAEVQARLQPTTPRVPSGVPLSPDARAGVVDFATSHGQIVRDWEDFHVRLDAWRDALTACEPVSVEVALRGFAASIGTLASQAGRLPRSVGVAGLADNLIVATEFEAEAIRRLRDGWRHDDPTVFDGVDLARSAALDLQREAQDALRDLQAKTTDESRARVGFYIRSVDDLNFDWDTFRQNYDSFRAQEPDLSSTEMVAGLSGLVDEFRDIVVTVRDLPADDVTRGVSTILAQAAEAEDLALRNLRGTFRKSEVVGAGPVEEAPDFFGGEFGFGGETLGPGESFSDPSAPSGQPATAAAFAPRDPTLFDAFDTQLARSNSLRREAEQVMADISDETSKDAQAAVGQYSKQSGVLLAEWRQFHSDYDDWRRTEGGCDRLKATGTLAQLTSDFAAITRRPRDVTGGTLLGPLRELLVEAAELEEEGLRDLRNTWRPFDLQVHKTYEGRRSSAARLLRQVAVGLDSLLAQYDIPAPVP